MNYFRPIYSKFYVDMRGTMCRAQPHNDRQAVVEWDHKILKNTLFNVLMSGSLNIGDFYSAPSDGCRAYFKFHSILKDANRNIHTTSLMFVDIRHSLYHSQ